MQLSAVSILNYLVNDMLDYAQLGAGQFRKFESIFNLQNAISDILKVLEFKAK